MPKSELTIEEKVLATFAGKESKIFRRGEILDMVLKKIRDKQRQRYPIRLLLQHHKQWHQVRVSRI
jgi:hypothetical protein